MTCCAGSSTSRWSTCGQLEFDLVGRQVVEQPPSLPEQHRYDVQFQLVELSGPNSACAAPAPCTITSPFPAAAQPARRTRAHR